VAFVELSRIGKFIDLQRTQLLVESEAFSVDAARVFSTRMFTPRCLLVRYACGVLFFNNKQNNVSCSMCE
jgi:hypothetical protein